MRSDLRSPSTVYRQRERLHSGGLATLYTATREDGLPVVLREVPLDTLTPDVRGTLLVGLQCAEGLSVVGVLPVLESWTLHEHGRSMALQVTPFCGGETLTEWSSHRVLSEADVLERLQEILTILDRLHAAGLCHRDVHPDNLLVDEHGQLLLIDLALLAPITLDHAAPVSTFGYTAPEALLGAVSPAADVYAAGMVAVRLFAGVPLTKLPPDAAQRTLRWENSLQVTAETFRLFEDLLDPNPAHRPTAGEAAERARRCAHALDTTAAPALLPRGTAPRYRGGQGRPSSGRRAVLAEQLLYRSQATPPTRSDVLRQAVQDALYLTPWTTLAAWAVLVVQSQGMNGIGLDVLAGTGVTVSLLLTVGLTGATLRSSAERVVRPIDVLLFASPWLGLLPPVGVAVVFLGDPAALLAAAPVVAVGLLGPLVGLPLLATLGYPTLRTWDWGQAPPPDDAEPPPAAPSQSDREDTGSAAGGPSVAPGTSVTAPPRAVQEYATTGKTIRKPDADPMVLALANLFLLGYLIIGQPKKAVGFLFATLLLSLIGVGLILPYIAAYDAYLLGQRLAAGESITPNTNGLSFLDVIFKD